MRRISSAGHGLSLLGPPHAIFRLALVASLSVHAFAQSASTQLKVTTTVVKNCTITSTDVSFGSYDPVGANRTAPLDGVGSLTITCTTGTPATLGLDTGGNGNRRMNNGSGVYLAYPRRPFVGHGETGQVAFTRTVPGWYVLPGRARRFESALSPDECRAAKTITARAVTDGGPVDARATVSASACGGR